MLLRITERGGMLTLKGWLLGPRTSSCCHWKKRTNKNSGIFGQSPNDMKLRQRWSRHHHDSNTADQNSPRSLQHFVLASLIFSLHRRRLEVFLWCEKWSQLQKQHYWCMYLEHSDVQLAPLQAGPGSFQVAIQPPQQVNFFPCCVIGRHQHCGSVQQQLGDSTWRQPLLHCLLTELVQGNLWRNTHSKGYFTVFFTVFENWNNKCVSTLHLH